MACSANQADDNVGETLTVKSKVIRMRQKKSKSSTLVVDRVEKVLRQYLKTVDSTYPRSDEFYHDLLSAYLKQFPDEKWESHFHDLSIESDDKQWRSNSAYQSIDAPELSIRIVKHLKGNKPILELALNKKITWYIQKAAIEALDTSSLTDSDWEELMSLIENRQVPGEIREPALRLLAGNGRKEFIQRIHLLKNNPEPNWHDSKLSVVCALAELGEAEVLVDLIEESYNLWSYKQTMSREALKALQESLGGLEAVEQKLALETGLDNAGSQGDLSKSKNPFVRRWNLEWSTTVDTTKLIDAFHDPDWGVREQARRKLISISDPNLNARLKEVFENTNATLEVRSWAGATLEARKGSANDLVGEDTPSEIWRVPWSFDCPDQVRDTIVGTYGENGEHGTDVRYRIEASLVPNEYSEECATQDRNRLIEELKANSIEITEVQDAGEYNQQGWGSFWVLRLGEHADASELRVSTFMPAVMLMGVRRRNHGKSVGYTGPQEDSVYHRIAETLGFQWIGSDLAKQVVPDLCVYFFGKHEPLPVSDLLFYWQD